MMKIYFGRSQSYMSMVSASMLLFLTLSDLNTKGYININISKYFIVLIIAGAIIFTLIGYLETRYLKGMQVEQQYASEYNPFLVDIKNKIDYLYEKA